MKKNRVLIECIIIFIFSFLFYWLTTSISFDDIWNYGFSYNIANGLIPYRDFNMVVTPFYPIFISIFLKINSSIFMFYQVNALINTLMYYLVRKEKGSSAVLFVFFSLLFCAQGYNLFLLFLFILLIYLENNNYSPLLVGIVASFAVLTKQSVFPSLTIAFILASNKKSIKYRLIGYTIPFIIFFIYLIINNSLYNFIDYCFLGLKSFGQNNFVVTSFILLAIYITINLYMVYLLIKSHFKDKELLYILSFQILALPIFEFSHVSYCFIISIYYILDKFSLNLKSEILLFGVILIIPVIQILISWNKISFRNKLNIFNGRAFNTEVDNYIYECIEKIKNFDYDDLYVFDGTSYIIKLEMKQNINKYDLINNGNMGSGGAKKYIDEIKVNCKDKICLFVLRNYQKNKTDQLSIEIIDYVKNNYELIDSVNYFEFYQNS